MCYNLVDIHLVIIYWLVLKLGELVSTLKKSKNKYVYEVKKKYVCGKKVVDLVDLGKYSYKVKK